MYVKQSCDLCGHPCSVVWLQLDHRQLTACLQCCLQKPQFLLGATICLGQAWKDCGLPANGRAAAGPPAQLTVVQSSSTSDYSRGGPLPPRKPRKPTYVSRGTSPDPVLLVSSPGIQLMPAPSWITFDLVSVMSNLGDLCPQLK